MPLATSLADLFHDKYLWLSLVFDCATVGATTLVYFSVGYFTNLRYLQWAENLDAKYPNLSPNPLKEPLPDVFLSVIPRSWNTGNAVGFIADTVPFACLLIGLGSCIVQRYADLANHVAMTFLFLCIWNGIVENITVIPSSYGYDRCVNYLGLGDAKFTAPKSQHYEFSIGLMGTCTAMMWSGHTQQTMLGIYGLLSGLERRWPKSFLTRKIGKKYSGVSVKTVIVNFSALIEGILLICNFGHYASDIIVGFFVTALCLSNGKIKYWCTRMNPFLKGHWVLSTRVEKSKNLDIVMEILESEHPEIYIDIKARLEKSSWKRQNPAIEHAKSDSIVEKKPGDTDATESLPERV